MTGAGDRAISRLGRWQVSVISIQVIVNVAEVHELKSMAAWQELGSALT